MRFIYPKWDDIEKLCDKLVHKLGSYRPDVLIGISRGGLVPVRIISDMLANKNVAIFRMEFYTGVGTTKEKPEITQPLTIDIKDKTVLLVDDVSDSGRSLTVAKDYIERLGAKEVKIATLHFKPKSSFRPDYFVDQTDAWIIYPWEVREAKRQLKKLADASKDFSD